MECFSSLSGEEFPLPSYGLLYKSLLVDKIIEIVAHYRVASIDGPGAGGGL